MNNDAITSDPTWTLQVHKVVWYQAVLLIGRSSLLQLSTFFLFKLLARWQQILLDLCKESGSKNDTESPSRNKLMTCAIGHIPTKTSGSGCASLVFCFAANACFFSSKNCVTFTTKTNSCRLAKHIWDHGTTSDSIKWKGPTDRCPKNHLYKLISKKFSKNLPFLSHFWVTSRYRSDKFLPPRGILCQLYISLLLQLHQLGYCSSLDGHHLGVSRTLNFKVGELKGKLIFLTISVQLVLKRS